MALYLTIKTFKILIEIFVIRKTTYILAWVDLNPKTKNHTLVWYVWMLKS